LSKKGKPVVCYKCGKPGHKAFQCKTEQKINELFSGDPDLKQKLLALLTQEALESDEDYYAEESEESDYESSPLQALNVITSKPQKEFLIDLIGQIPDLDAKRDYLERLKGIILKEDKPPKFSLEAPTSSSINHVFNKYPIFNPYQQVTTKQLQTEVHDLKTQVRFLKT